MIELRKAEEIEKLRKANQIVARTLDYLESKIKAGMKLSEIADLAEDFILKAGAKPSFKGLYDFPSAICTSLNNVCIHGIADDKIIKEGDVLGLDVGTFFEGYYGDAARTIGIGKISQKDEKLIACAKDALYFAIDSIKVGMRFKQLSALLEKFIKSRGFVPLQGYCGHGIGTKPHCEPEILNYLEEGDSEKNGFKIKNGMVFCLEPMICQKDGTPAHFNGRWDAGSADGLNTAHYEHCVAIVKGRAQILSTFP